MKSRLFALVLALIACVAATLAVQYSIADKAPKSSPNIVFITGGSSAYWQTTANGAKAASKSTGAKVEVLMPEKDEDVTEQIRMLMNVDHKTVDGVAVSPLDAVQETRIINHLSEDSLVVTFDSDAPLSTRMIYVGASNLAAGQQAAGLMKEALPEGGKVAVLVANLTKNNTLERVRGFEEALGEVDPTSEAAADYEVVEVVVDNGDDEVARQEVQRLLDENDDLAGIVGMNAQHGPLLIALLREAGRLEGVRLVTFDDLPETLQGVEDGAVYATIAQDPYHYGFEAVRSLVRLHATEDDERPVAGSLNTVTIATQAVRKDNLDEFRRVAESLANGAGE